jgi:nanoRNase/pAp phosphatase (c-di-AMP/oligoRNAs hydrolase)
VYEEESLGAETWKVSLRSVGAVDTTPATKAFGGGGHANASSCNVARSVFASWRRG